MAESAPLLREYGLIPHRGFESLPLRHIKELVQYSDSNCSKNVVRWDKFAENQNEDER